MNEMLVSGPKSVAPKVNAVFSSDAKLLLTSIPSHWSIKNQVHWVSNEYDRRIRRGHEQHNLAILRRLALNLLRRVKSAQTCIATRCKRACWKTNYVQKILSQ